LVLAGASGKTGHEVLKAAAKGGWRVRALSSDLERARSELGSSYRFADWYEVDLSNTAALQPVVAGATHVISAIGARAFAGARSPQFVDFGGNVNLIDAARAAGVKHFALISSSRAGTHADQTKAEAFGYSRFWKTRAEEHLRLSGLNYTVIGPGGLTNDPPRRLGLRVLAREVYESTDVSRADVARVALAALTDPTARNKSFAIINAKSAGIEGWRAELAALPADRPADEELRSLATFGWIAGYWRSDAANGIAAEEVWLAPAGGLMLGMNRSVSERTGRASYEYIRLESQGGGRAQYCAEPKGQPSACFALTSGGLQKAAFTNLRSDYPQSIVYWRVGTELHARIDGLADGKPRSQHYRFLPVTNP
jgi:uncharacterized protein YbjT (DUF2867 family)